MDNKAPAVTPDESLFVSNVLIYRAGVRADSALTLSGACVLVGHPDQPFAFWTTGFTVFVTYLQERMRRIGYIVLILFCLVSCLQGGCSYRAPPPLYLRDSAPDSSYRPHTRFFHLVAR